MKQQQREQVNMEEVILKVATKLFLNKGYAATSTTEIAKEAGCNQALVHYYFRTKEKLFEAIFQHKMNSMMAAITAIDVGNLPFIERLEKRIEAHFDAIAMDPKLPQFLFSEISQNPNRIDAIRAAVGKIPKQALDHLKKELETEINAGNIRPTTAENLIMTMASLNVMVFLGEPVFRLLTNMSDEEYAVFREARKKENVAIVLRSIVHNYTGNEK